MAHTVPQMQFEAALRAVDSPHASAQEKTEMLMEIAMGMQVRPKSPAQILDAVTLYERALGTCPAELPLLRARVTARMGTALQALPGGGADGLERARACYEESAPVLAQLGLPAEAAEAQMNLGLVLQSLAGLGAARVVDAVQCYHRALKVFDREHYPQEYAILHNNLAIAYLSIPLADERGKMREALAVQSFEEVLRVVTLVDHPAEYAMIQNNLGNALQYASSSHALENNLRALAAYDEALRVRNARDTPLEFANTISNKANVLRNLPDDPARPGAGRAQARELYSEAQRIFERFGEREGARVVREALLEIDDESAARAGSATGSERAGSTP